MIGFVQDGSLIPRFGRARRDRELAVLEGLHAVKHAMRFGATMLELVTPDLGELEGLAAQLAPDLLPGLAQSAREVQLELFEQLAPLAPSTGVIGLAERAQVNRAGLLAEPTGAPVVLLEDPRDLGNLGACVRVAAGAEAAGVLTTGSQDPWHPDALRGAAGLHYAQPVARLASLEELDGLTRPLVALDPQGEEFDPSRLDPGSVLTFGTERHGLSPQLSARADARVSIPMRPGVSSLNLATSVAAVLFSWRLSRR